MIGAFQRVDGNIHLQRPFYTLKIPERLTYPEHRRIISLSFTDGHPPIERNRIEHGSHRLDCRSVCEFSLAFTTPLSRSNGCRLTGAKEVRR